jgi:acyl-CoA thioesterase FadM
VGVTADLRIRYLRPLLVGREVTVRAWLERSRRLTHELGAELVQDGEPVARATGKFMEHPG